MKKLNSIGLGILRGGCLLILLLGAGCATNPVTGKKEFRLVSRAKEIQIGTQNYLNYQQMQGGDYITNKDIPAYVERVGKKLASVSDTPELPFEFVVLNNSVPNAWALPGGKIAINRGLLTELGSEAELAAVLGHEIVHAAARHTAKGMERGMLLQGLLIGAGVALRDNDYRDIIMGASGMGAQLVNMKYGRDAERESDHYGIKYMSKAGYDPKAAVDLQETFVRLSEGKDPGMFEVLFASHPPSKERVEANKETMKEYAGGVFMGEQEYRRALRPLRKAEQAYKKLDDGVKALKRNDPHTALKLAREAQRIEPREAHLYGLAGQAYAMMDKERDALRAWDKAIQLNDNFYDYHLQKGRILLAQGNATAARASLQKSVSLLPTATGHHALGIIAMKSGRKQQAFKHFQVAANSDSPAGKESRMFVARMELPSNPSKYLRMSYGLGHDKRLVLAITNRSPLPVRNVQVRIRAANAEGRMVFDKNMTVRKSIRSGETINVTTRVGPFDSPDAVRSLVRVDLLTAAVD